MICVSRWIPDPLFHRYEIADSDNKVLHVTDSEKIAHAHFQAVVNEFLDNTPVHVKKDFPGMVD